MSKIFFLDYLKKLYKNVTIEIHPLFISFWFYINFIQKYMIKATEIVV